MTKRNLRFVLLDVAGILWLTWLGWVIVTRIL